RTTARPSFAPRTNPASENLDFTQGNAELLIGRENFRIDLVDRRHLLLRLRRGVIIEVLVVDLWIIDAPPGGLVLGDQAAMALQPPLQHPGRFILLCGNEADGVFRQPLRRFVGFDQRLASISVLLDVDAPDALDRLLYSRHSILRSRFQGPRWTCLETLLRCFTDEITCLEPFKPCFVPL